MNLLVLMAAASVFFTLQALYWIVVSRKGSKQALLAERLGTDESMSASAALMRRENEGALAQSLAQLLEEAGEEPSLGPFLVRVGLWFFMTFTVVLLVTGSLGAGMVLGMAATVLPYLGLLRKRRKRVQRIEEQLPEALEVMIISLRAGQSLDQTIRLTASELDAPIGDEFHRVAEEVQLGRPLEEALVAMSARLAAARTVRTFVTSVLVLRQTGGNLIEVLEQIIDTMRQQSQYERKLSAMTAEGRSSARMLAGLPPIFVLLAYAADANYIGTLVNDPIGRVLLTVAIIMYTAGVVWTRRLTNPKT